MTDTDVATTATTTTISAAAIEELVDRYIAIWNERDETRRRALIAETWAADAEYLDPLLAGAGRDGIDAMTAGFQGAYPGHAFKRAGAVDQHHDRVRFGWLLQSPDGQTLAIGQDFGELNAENLFRAMTGFFEQA